jgi:ribosomal protein L32
MNDWREFALSLNRDIEAKAAKAKTFWTCESCGKVSAINAFCGQCGDAEPSIKRQVEILRKVDTQQ